MREQSVSNPPEGQVASPPSVQENPAEGSNAPALPQSLEEAHAALQKAQGDAEKYQALMRSEEGKKKALFNELDALKKGQMSEADRTIAEAEERGRKAAEAAFAEEKKKLKLSSAAKAAGVPEEVLGILDADKLFVDGEVNTELLSTLSGGRQSTFQKSARDLGIGSQSNSNAGQLTRQDLARMNPADIMKARKEGRLDALMKGQI